MKNKKQLWFLAIPVTMAILLTISIHFTNIADPEKLDLAQEISRWVVNLGFLLSGLFCLGYWFLVGKRFGWHIPGLKLWPCMGSLLLVRAAIMYRALIKDYPFVVGPELYFALHVITMTVFYSMAGLLIIMARYAWRQCPKGMDALIVLGCLSGSKVLYARADAAADYMQRNSNCVTVCSGGQGSNETISEAESIRERILTHGIDDGRLILENKSRNTLQNLAFSAQLLPDPGCSVAVVTDDYHQFRARFIARSVLKRPVYGIPVHTSRVTLIHYLVKEYFSFLLLLAKRVIGKHN